jgi:hypothetical protein
MAGNPAYCDNMNGISVFLLLIGTPFIIKYQMIPLSAV